MLSEEEKQNQIIATKKRIDEINKDISYINVMTATDIENYISTGTTPYSEKERLKNERYRLEHDLINLENGCSNSGCTVSGGRRYKKKKTIKRRKYTKKNNKSKKSNRK
jgi:hypothetical protein